MAAARCLRRVLGAAGSPCSGLVRGTATVIPKVTQVDNSLDFLAKVPHRKHPGILHIKCVQLPSELSEVAQFLVSQSSRRNLEKDVKALTNYLWSRRRPVEVEDLQRKALEVEKKLMKEAGRTYQAGAQSSLDEAEEKNLQSKVFRIIRKTTYHWEALKYTDDLSFLYMAARMDGVFAAVFRAFHEIQKRVPDFQPATLLDFGSGTGAVSWAAHGTWGKTIREYMNIDRSAPMLALAERLMKGVSEEEELCFPGVYFRQFLPVSPKVKYDLVVSAFSLNELPSYSERVETVQTLWRKTDGFLVLVENGTKEGHQMLMEARDVVLKHNDKVLHDRRKPYVFAPCPHHLPCPHLSSANPLPCNFIQKYHPLPFHWNPGEREEVFSFLILGRVSEEPKERWPRIIKPVLCRSRHVHVHLCSASGTIQHAIVTPGKHGRDLYRCARSSMCGDRLPVLNPDSKLDLSEDRSHPDRNQS